MDDDLVTEPEVDWFSCVLPLPFRTAIIFVVCEIALSRTKDPRIWILTLPRYLAVGRGPTRLAFERNSRLHYLPRFCQLLNTV